MVACGIEEVAEEVIRSRQRDAAAKGSGKEKTDAGDVVSANAGSLHAVLQSLSAKHVPVLNDFLFMLGLHLAPCSMTLGEG